MNNQQIRRSGRSKVPNSKYAEGIKELQKPGEGIDLKNKNMIKVNKKTLRGIEIGRNGDQMRRNADSDLNSDMMVEEG